MVRLIWSNEKRKLSELIPWPRNPRQIKTDQAKRLVESFNQFGQVETIAIGPDGDIYNGHQRLNVLAEKYGSDYEVDVRVASRALSEKEREKLTVFLHKGAAGEWDFDVLANEFELEELLEWGFDKKELDLDLWADDAPDDPGAQMDKAEELREKWGVETGQLWQLGEHRLICGDCTDKSVVDALMQGELAGAVVTDPPYGIDVVGSDGRIGYAAKFGRIEGDLQPFDPIHLLDMANEVVLWGANHYADKLPSSSCWLVWDKRDGDRRNDLSDCELAWCKGKGVIRILHHLWMGYARASERDEKRQHPTQKPIVVMDWVLVERTNKGDIVIDPYLGSGTTLIACERLGRKCRAVEISPAYCAVAIQRWVDMTGGVPKLVENGRQ